MRIIVVFSNHDRYIPRPRTGDICIIARKNPDDSVETKVQGYCTVKSEQGIPFLDCNRSKDELRNIIHNADKINVEIIGHGSKGAKSIQSDKTDFYPRQNIALDDLATWVENDLLNGEIGRSTISLLACEGADGNDKYPAMAAQLFELFETKPLKLTARIGFCYIEEKIYSLGTFDMLMKSAEDHEDTSNLSFLEQFGYPVLQGLNKFFTYSKDTPLGEKFLYFKGDGDINYKIDNYQYKLFESIKMLDSIQENPRISSIIIKNIENVSANEFKLLAKFAKQTSPDNEKLHEYADKLLNGEIKSAIPLKTNMAQYDNKKYLKALINNILKHIDSKADLIGMVNKTAWKDIIKKADEFISYRYERNYPIDEFEHFIADGLFYGIINCSGHMEPKLVDFIKNFSDYMKNPNTITNDYNSRIAPIGLRPSSFFSDVESVTKTKNLEFADAIDDFLSKCVDEYSPTPGPKT